MRDLNLTLVLLFLLGLLGAVGAWPNRAELMVGALGFMGCATFFSLNLLRSAREYQQEVPAIGSDEEVFEDVSISSLPLALPLPTPTTTSDGTPTTTIAQTDLLPSITRESRSFYTVFELDPPETATLFSGSPSVPKLVVAEVFDNGTVISAEIVVRLADAEERFRDFTYLSPTETTSPVTAPTTYSNTTLGVNIPTPDSSDPNTTSSTWALPSFIVHALQDNTLKPFVESARRKLNFFWGLRNTIFGPLVRLLPVHPQMLGFILMSVKLVSLWFPGMARRRRRVPVLQRLGWIRNPQLAIEAAPGAGPQLQPSVVDAIEEAEAIVQGLESLNLVVERRLDNGGRQEEDRDDDSEYVDAVDEQIPVVQQMPVEVRRSGFIMRPLPPPSRSISPTSEAATSTSETAGDSTDATLRSPEQPGSTLRTSSQPAAEPPKFPSTRSTAPIAEHVLRRRLPITRYREMPPHVLTVRPEDAEDMRPDLADPKKSLRDIYRPTSTGPSASATAPLSTKSSGAIDDTVPVPVSGSAGVTPSAAAQQPAARPQPMPAKAVTQLLEREVKEAEIPAGHVSQSTPQPAASPVVEQPAAIQSSDIAPPQRKLTKAELKDEQYARALQDAEIERAKTKSSIRSPPQPQLDENSRNFRVGLLKRRFQDKCGVEDLDSAQLRRFLDFFGIWDAVNRIPANVVYQQWTEYQAYEKKSAAEKGQAATTASKAGSTEAESTSAVEVVRTAAEIAQQTEPQPSNVTPPLKVSSAQRPLLSENVRTATKTAQPAEATAEVQSSNVASRATKLNSAQRSLLRDTLRNRLNKSFGVQDTDSKKVEQFLDVFGWHKLSLENLNEVCEAWLAREAEQTAKAAATLSNLSPPAPVAASEGEQAVTSTHESSSTVSAGKTESSENAHISPILDQSPDAPAQQQPPQTQSNDVSPVQPDTTDPHYRASLVTYLRTEIRDKLAVEDVNEDHMHEYLDWFGWENVGEDNYLDVCKSFLDAVAVAKEQVGTHAASTARAESEINGESSQARASSVDPEATSTSSEIDGDEDEGTNANRHEKLEKPEEDLPQMSPIKGDSDDDNDDSHDGPLPPPSSGAVVEGTSSTEIKPTEESNNTVLTVGEGNGSGHEGHSTRSTALAPVTAPPQWPVFNGFQFNVQSHLPERPVYQVSDEDRIFRVIPDASGASTPRRSALRNRERDADEVASRLGHLGRARIAVNDDGSPVAETCRFRAQEPPARIQRAYHMDIDGEGQEATGIPAPAPVPRPAPTQPALVQSSPGATEFSPEMEGVESQEVHDAMDGVETPELHEEMEGIEKSDLHEEMDGVESDEVCLTYPGLQLEQSMIPQQQPIPYISPYNVVPPSSEPPVQDQQMTMTDEQAPSNAALSDAAAPNQADSHQAQMSQYDLHGLPTLETTEWNNLEAIDEQERQRQQEPQQQPIVLQGQDWADPEDFFGSIGLSPHTTGAGLSLDLAGEMPEIRSLLDSLLPGGRSEYDPHDPQAGMERVEMDSCADGAQYAQRAPQVAPTPMQPAAGDLPYGDPSEYAVGQQNATDVANEQSDVTPEALASTSQPAMSAWDRARLRTNMQSTESGSPQNTVNQHAHTGEEPLPDDRMDELREWGVTSRDGISKLYKGHVQRKTLRPRSRLAALQTSTAQANPFQNLLQPQSNTIVNPQDIQIPKELAAALQRRHNQTQGGRTSQPMQQPPHPDESHTDRELNPAPGPSGNGSFQNSNQSERDAEDESFSDISDLNEEERSQQPAYLQVSGSPSEQPHHDEDDDESDNLSDVPDLDEEQRREILARLQGLGSPSTEHQDHGEDSSEGALSPPTHHSQHDDISFEDSVENYLIMDLFEPIATTEQLVDKDNNGEDEESGRDEGAEEEFHVGHKRSRDDDEVDDEDENDDGVVKRHQKAKGSRSEPEQEYRYGNDEGTGKKKYRDMRQVATMKRTFMRTGISTTGREMLHTKWSTTA
ncbi:hypothetical protein CLCR_02706 [Cladophialophora carrionii]|uniref:Uncharacterized protein n=1 Tax=Cladophialophora carrionii TaxID=86049 RepID=A0A1C1D2Y2_9EURO|nr:hypothetical protein CLCR_02706 [Cladophialophora carrionii]